MKHIVLILSMFLSVNALSQSVVERSNEFGRLPWVNGDLPTNKNQVNYKVIFVDGNTLNEARDAALSVLVTDLGKDKGVTVSSTTVRNVKETISNQSPNFFNSSTSRELKITFDDYTLSFNKVDEYYEVVKTAGGNKIMLWHLYAIDGYPEFQSLSYTSDYGLNTTLKSAIIPGWGQFEKKQITKGILFLAAETAAIGLYLNANNNYNYNISRRDESQSLELKKSFQKEADNNIAIKNISLAGAAAIWIFNIIDANTPNGAPKYAFNDNINLNFTSNQNERLAINFKYNLK